MNITVLDKTYTVELLVNPSSTQQQIYFPIIQNLDNKVTNGISTYIPEVIPSAPSSRDLANSALLGVSYLNLVVDSETRIWNLPLLELVTLNSQPFTGVASNPFKVELNNLKIIWAKSWIFIADVSRISVATPEVFLFNISYQDIK